MELDSFEMRWVEFVGGIGLDSFEVGGVCGWNWIG